jgi:putative ABC transport system ATP-binding protein
VNSRDSDAVRLEAVRKMYGKGDSGVVALASVTIGLPRGGFTAVMGPSGSGKSTFLHCAAGLDQPTSGSVVLDGEDLTAMNETNLTKLRRDRIGFIFQAFNLLPALAVEQNVTVPQLLAGRRPNKKSVHDVLARVGLLDRRGHSPAELSGGSSSRSRSRGRWPPGLP